MIGNEKMRSFGIRVFSFFFVLFLSGFWIQGVVGYEEEGNAEERAGWIYSGM